MRTTIRLDDTLLAKVKQIAAESNRTLTAVIEDALRESINRRKQSAKARAAFKVTTFGGDGVMPGIDLNSNASVLDAMDGTDAPF
jgi:hypothetical protein